VRTHGAITDDTLTLSNGYMTQCSIIPARAPAVMCTATEVVGRLSYSSLFMITRKHALARQRERAQSVVTVSHNFLSLGRFRLASRSFTRFLPRVLAAEHVVDLMSTSWQLNITRPKITVMPQYVNGLYKWITTSTCDHLRRSFLNGAASQSKRLVITRSPALVHHG